MVSKVPNYFDVLFALTPERERELLELNSGDDKARVYGLRLIEGTRIGNSVAAKFLLAHGADINCQDEYGMTALHYAAAYSARSCIRLLTSFNECNYLLQDYKGRYASELAYEWGRDYAVGHLLSKKQVRQAYVQGVSAWDKPKRNL